MGLIAKLLDDNLKLQHEVARLTIESGTLWKENEELRAANYKLYGERKRLFDEVTELDVTLTETRADRDVLAEQRNEFSRLYAAADKTLDRVLPQLERLGTERNELCTERDTLRTEIAEWYEELERVRSWFKDSLQANDELRADRDRIELDRRQLLTTFRLELDELRAENKELRMKLDVVVRERDALRNTY
jgi:chromosome segregation ATPase